MKAKRPKSSYATSKRIETDRNNAIIDKHRRDAFYREIMPKGDRKMDDMIQASTLIEVLYGLTDDALEEFLSQYDEEWVMAILNHADIDHVSMDTTDEQIDAVRKVVANHF